MLIEGTPYKINYINELTYMWKTGSEHSITRIGVKENDGIPLYNWNLCQVGATAAAINAIQFCQKKNPFNGEVTRFATEQMVGLYFTYIQCLNIRPIFAEQCYFNAKRFYNACFKSIEHNISDEILQQFYGAAMISQSPEMISIIPPLTFFEFMDKIKNDTFNSKEEFDEIRAKMPDWVIELDKKSGVLGEEGYIYTDNELSEKK